MKTYKKNNLIPIAVAIFVVVLAITLSFSFGQYVTFWRTGNLAMINSLYNTYGKAVTIENLTTHPAYIFSHSPTKKTLLINKGDTANLNRAINGLPCLKPNSASLSNLNKKSTLILNFDTQNGIKNCLGLQAVDSSGNQCQTQIMSTADIQNGKKVNDAPKDQYKYEIQRSPLGICNVMSAAFCLSQKIKCDAGVPATVKNNLNVEYLDKLGQIGGGPDVFRTLWGTARMHKNTCPSLKADCGMIEYNSGAYDIIPTIDFEKYYLFMPENKQPTNPMGFVLNGDNVKREATVADYIKRVNEFVEKSNKPNVDCTLGFSKAVPFFAHLSNIVSMKMLDADSLQLTVKNTLYQGTLEGEKKYTDIPVNGNNDTVIIDINKDGTLDLDYKSNPKEKVQRGGKNFKMDSVEIMCCEYSPINDTKK